MSYKSWVFSMVIVALGLAIRLIVVGHEIGVVIPVVLVTLAVFVGVVGLVKLVIGLLRR